MSDEKCKNCGERTEYMFHLNNGLYCESCWNVQYEIQRMDLKLQETNERMESLSWRVRHNYSMSKDAIEKYSVNERKNIWFGVWIILGMVVWLLAFIGWIYYEVNKVNY